MGQTEPAGRAWASTWRALLVWAGLATLTVLVLLAAWHLIEDIRTVLGIRGGLSAVAGRLLPVAVLALVGAGLIVAVGWLSGQGRQRQLIAVGIGLAVLVVVRVFLSFEFDSGTRGEPAVYGLMAESFLTDEPDRFGRPPGYALLLAGAYAFIADRQLGTEVVNLLLALAVAGVLWALASGRYGSRVGALTVLAYALWPAAALMTVVRIPHIAFDLTVLLAAWAALAIGPGWRGNLLTGGALALAQYVRPTAPILLPAYIVARWWPGATWQRQTLTAVVTAAGFVLLMVPMIVDNYDRTGSPSISTSDYGGNVLYMGTNEASGGEFSQEASEFLIEQAGSDALDRSRLGTELALERIRTDPLGIAALAVRKQDTLWGTERYGAQYAISQNLRDRPQHPRVSTPILLSQGFYVLVLLAALAGAWLRRHADDALIALATLVIWAATATHTLLEVRDRHHAYAVVLLLPLAAVAVARLFDAVERRAARQRPE
jgi:hypothetical protein